LSDNSKDFQKAASLRLFPSVVVLTAYSML